MLQNAMMKGIFKIAAVIVILLTIRPKDWLEITDAIIYRLE